MPPVVVLAQATPPDWYEVVDVPEVYLVREIFRLKAFTPSCLLYINTFDTLYFSPGHNLHASEDGVWPVWPTSFSLLTPDKRDLWSSRFTTQYVI